MKKALLFILITFQGFLYSQTDNSRISTKEDRAALFDYIIQKTMEREAFSEIKDKNLNMDVKTEMLKYRDEFINVTTEEELYWAILKLSNARKDKHVNVTTAKDGLQINKVTRMQAPIHFDVDYSIKDNYFLFISEYSKDIQTYTGKNKLEIGDRLIAVNEIPAAEYIKKVEPFQRYSTVNNFWKRLDYSITTKSGNLPSYFYKENLTLTLEKKNKEKYTITIPYLDPAKIDWNGFNIPKYPGFKSVYKLKTHELFLPDNSIKEKVIILRWFGFLETVKADVDSLIRYADKNNLLDHNLIIDLTNSQGGSLGAYVVQHLSPKPFKTTFGNLRISDVTPLFIEQKNKEFKEKNVNDGGSAETMDDGSNLIDWLNDDVKKAIAATQAYTNNVPFKLAHLPKYSDGIVYPATKHFKGKMVCFMGPWGGSHLDQFNATVADNDLAYTLGMTTGGYSNTWEWTETLKFPISGKSVCNFMWSVGHTIRPNGEILEGNPSAVDEYIPLTRDNYLIYYDILLKKAFEYLK
ncbi:MAG: hypothetical protein ACT4ON_04085 [Bacteroidota bacterium]